MADSTHRRLATPRRRSGGGGRARIGLAVALFGGLLLAIAAAQRLAGVFAQKSALSRLEAPRLEAASAQENESAVSRLETPRSLEAAFAQENESALSRLETLRRLEAAFAQENESALSRLETLSPAPAPRAPQSGEVFGRLRIPSVGIDLAIFEGVSVEVLRKGPGHVPGTGFPTPGGRGGNAVIAGHRDSFFRGLARAKPGDVVLLNEETGERAYRLARRRVVEPTEVGVLAETPREQLTLLTCYPFAWIGPAPYRLVWEAVPVASATAAGAPAPGEAAGAR